MASAGSQPTSVSSMHDVELAALAAAGERQAFGELVRRHGGSVRLLLRRLGAERDAADAIARDAFVGGFEQIGEFRGEGTFSVWIRRRAALVYLRRTRRARTQAVGGGGAARIAPGAGQEDGLDAALNALSPLERLCVGLSFGAGFTSREIAEHLRLSAGAVKSAMKTGLGKLRDQLEGLDPGSGPIG